MANRTKMDRLNPSPFLDGPGEFLAATVATLVQEDPHFQQIFGDSVDDYDRQDYSFRELPAIRFYVMNYTKETESHYINGDMHCDVILPPEIRRSETEKFPSQIANALLQQFRRPSFFAQVQVGVPGLNELGKVFSVDKTMSFQNAAMDDECPVVHITLNFRLDLKIWDDYLEKEGRTKDAPFDVTLANLAQIASVIQGIKINSDGTQDPQVVTLQTDQLV